MKLGIIAGCVSALASIPYFISIFRGKTKPNRATWWIWSWLGVLLFFSYKASGANDTLWVALVYMITPLLTAILSIKYGVGGWSKFDLICLASSIIGSLLWYVSGSPVIALLLFLLIDLCGTLPTIRKTYYHPEQENRLGWSIMVTANFINIFAGEMKFSIVVYPIYMVIIGGAILAFSLRKSPLHKYS